MLFYGIGLNKSISHSDNFSSASLTCIKSLFSATSTTAVGYLLVNWLLVPVQLTEVYPFIATLLFILFSTFIEIFIGIGVRLSPVDFSIPLLSVFLGSYFSLRKTASKFLYSRRRAQDILCPFGLSRFCYDCNLRFQCILV